MKPILHKLMPLMQKFNEYFGYSFDKQTKINAYQLLQKEQHFGGVWFIYAEDQLIGYIVLAVGFSFEYGGKDAFIDEFFILDLYRGKGIGKQVLCLIEKEAKMLGINALHLEVERSNNNAKQLYGKLGFKQNGQRVLLTKVLN